MRKEKETMIDLTCCWHCGKLLGACRPRWGSYHAEVALRQAKSIERDRRMAETPPEGWLELGRGRVRRADA